MKTTISRIKKELDNNNIPWDNGCWASIFYDIRKNEHKKQEQFTNYKIALDKQFREPLEKLNNLKINYGK